MSPSVRTSMITAQTLSALPGMIVAERGKQRLSFVCEKAGLPTSLPDNTHRDFYIPQLALLRFVDAAGRELGVPSMGLLAVHSVTVRDYGVWGDYVLTAPTLRESIQRALKVHHLHATGDILVASNTAGGMDLRYRSAIAGAASYENISYIGLGVIESVVQHFAGQSWRPAVVSLDFIESRGRDRIEEVLGSRVRFGDEHVRFFIPAHILELPNPHPKPAQEITIGDVVRARCGRSPVTPTEKVSALVRTQMLGGRPSLDQIADMLAIGTRTLQRRLGDDGTSFRGIVETAVLERAIELLGETNHSIGQIATDLGYSSPNHLARTFRRAKGLSPTEFRNVLSQKPRFDGRS